MRDPFIIEHCQPNCPRAARNWSDLVMGLDAELSALELEDKLKHKFGRVQDHYVPKISVSGCPNGCSRPQIKDLGLMGYVEPVFDRKRCSGCQTCVAACVDHALSWTNSGIRLDAERCLQCGDCLRACPTGALSAGKTGWRLLQGGRVGRHPRFADVAGRETDEQAARDWVISAVERYFRESLPGERFSFFLERTRVKKNL